MKHIRWFTFVVVGLSLSIGSTGCLKSQQVGYSSVVPDFPVSPSVQDTPVSTNPAQKTFSYHYYPSANIYYDTQRRLYFYSDGEDWYESVTLPAALRLNPDEVVALELATDTPFLAQEDYTHNLSYVKKGGTP